MSASSETAGWAMAPGTQLAGRYRIDGLLGKGGSGSVYSAFDLGQERAVALKLLAPEVLADEAGLARFRREADLAQRLSHPNVVRIFDFGRAPDGAAYMVLELVRGQTLAALLKAGGPLPAERIVRIGAQVLKGLMDAHALGIVHRDIKPSNVQVCDFPGEPDFVKILDFGIAKTPHLTGDTTGMTNTGQILGTPGYMAPEQILGWPTGPATDLYAVGLLLAEMITGRAVYAGGTAMQVIVAQASPAPVPLPTEVLSSPLGAVIQRATWKEPARRYGAASEMLTDLLAPARASRPVSVPAPPTAVPGSVGSGIAPPTFAQQPGSAAFPFAGGPGAVALGPSFAPRAAAGSSGAALVVAGLGVLVVGLAIAGAAYYVLGLRSPTSSAPLPPGLTGAAPAAPPSASSRVPAATARGAASGAAPGGAAPTAHAAAAAANGSLPQCTSGAVDNPVQAAASSAIKSCNIGPPFGGGVATVTFDAATGVADSVSVSLLDPGAAHAIQNPGVESCMKTALIKVRIQPCSGFTPKVSGVGSFSFLGPPPTGLSPSKNH